MKDTNLLAWVLLPIAASGIAFGQDSFGYVASSDVPFAYRDVSSTGAAILGGSDNATATLNLPFALRFYGVTYGSLCASTNGLISFGGCVANDFTNVDLTGQPVPGDRPVIAPLWMDLNFAVPSGASLVYDTLGATPNRLFVVQWNNAHAGAIPEALNFQVILAEGSNTILFQYLKVRTSSAANTMGAAATVGIRAAGGQTNGYCSQWSYLAPVLDDNTAILFTPPSAAVAVDVSGSVAVTTSAFVLNRLTQTYSGTVTLKNTSAAPLAAPLTIVLSSLTAGVTALGASGALAGQGPYYSVPGGNGLNPGQTVTVSVQFSNPSNVRIGFVVKTYSGSF